MRIPALIALSIALAGCGQSDPALTVTNATISANPNSAAIYAAIDNRGGKDRLTGIEIEGGVPISLHETTMIDGVMRMRPAETFDIPASGRLELKSGASHGMAMGKFASPSGLPLTFRFERHAPITVRADVTGPSGMNMEHEQ